MNVDPKLERVGGMASLLSGVVCAVFGCWDWQGHQTIWKVWAVMAVLLVLNAGGMFYSAGKKVAGNGQESKA